MSALELRGDEGGGFAHFLDGDIVHDGDVLALSTLSGDLYVRYGWVRRMDAPVRLCVRQAHGLALSIEVGQSGWAAIDLRWPMADELEAYKSALAVLLGMAERAARAREAA